MATIDYKEKYEQALERARQFMETPYLENSDDVVGFIFPELKESEDESIRKEITELVMQPTWKTEKEFHRRNELCAWLKKQGEQNPAWSEEDETGLSDALWAIQQARTIAKDENDMGTLWYAENWLKSIKDRVHQQPKQEWSEEDENHVKSILSTIECCKVQFPNAQAVVEAYNADIEWLKSLRPQNTWKPSDKQIKALNEAIYHVDDNIATQIAKLIGDLKKLNK